MEGLGSVFLLGIGMFLFLLWTLGVFAAKPKHFYLAWLGVPALGMVLLICLTSGIWFYRSLPSVVFHDSFGFDPTSDITFVNSLRHMPTDWDDSYLEFYTSDSTIERIVQDGFTTVSPDIPITESTAPKWWVPPTGPDIRIYVTNPDNRKFEDESFGLFGAEKLLIYDPNQGDSNKRHVYFRYRR